jgi:hypothetical protein
MSNTLALAAVTATLRFVLERSLGGTQPEPVGGAKVTTLHPRDIPAGTGTAGTGAAGEMPKGINVFLYQVTPNHAWNLTDLPTRAPDGALVRRPVCALDLHYLLTCYGDDEELDGQRLLARALLAVAGNAVLGRSLVRDALDEYSEDPRTGFLGKADLADQVELVKLSPAVLSLEELSKVWGALGTPYLLSQAISATVVLLEADVTPRTVLPVRERAVTVTPAAALRVVSAEPDPPGGPVGTGTVIAVRGTGLAGPGAAVRIGPEDVEPADPVAADLLRVTVPDGVPAGVHPLQVTHRAPSPAGGPARVTRSNALPVLVRPRVEVDEVTATAVTLTSTPALFPGQRATVGLTGLDPGAEPPALTVELERLPPEADPSATITLARTGIPDGRWLVRLTVDGAESLPEPGADGTYSEPRLELA